MPRNRGYLDGLGYGNCGKPWVASLSDKQRKVFYEIVDEFNRRDAEGMPPHLTPTLEVIAKEVGRSCSRDTFLKARRQRKRGE